MVVRELGEDAAKLRQARAWPFLLRSNGGGAAVEDVGGLATSPIQSPRSRPPRADLSAILRA